MTDSWTDKWNHRYSQAEYAFGTEPNIYLERHLRKVDPGMILFPAEGEGRNAVYAAKLGWTVFAFDLAIEGKNKALLLAEENKVHIDYQIGELPTLNYKQGQFDAIALIYAHFPPEIRSMYHKLLDTYLRKGGTIILEAFNKKHLDYVTRNPNVGGPRDLPTLFSREEIMTDFGHYDVVELEETETELSEGLYHVGLGSVIRFVGRKR